MLGDGCPSWVADAMVWDGAGGAGKRKCLESVPMRMIRFRLLLTTRAVKGSFGTIRRLAKEKIVVNQISKVLRANSGLRSQDAGMSMRERRMRLPASTLASRSLRFEVSRFAVAPETRKDSFRTMVIQLRKQDVRKLSSSGEKSELVNRAEHLCRRIGTRGS